MVYIQQYTVMAHYTQRGDLDTVVTVILIAGKLEYRNTADTATEYLRSTTGA